jgi:type IV pilus assembly protein PilQ
MRMYPRRILCHAMALIALSTLSSGCVKRMSATNEPARTGASAFATLRSVVVSPDASLVELSSDKPFTYTSYKAGEPAKIVVDISQTVPGQVVTPIEVNRGHIRRIDLVRQPVGGGVLTRVEITLSKDVDFTASTAPSDRTKLEIHLLGGDAEAKPAQIEIKEPVLADPKIEERSLVTEASAAPQAAQVVTEVKVAEQAEVSPAAPSESKDPAAAVPSTDPVVVAGTVPVASTVVVVDAAVKSKEEEPARAVRRLNAILLASDGVELSIEGGVQTFNSFKLTKPDRIVLDLFGMKSTLQKNVVPIGEFGVANARVGSTPDKVRIVLDAAQDALPPFEVVKSDLGLKILLKPAAASPAAQAVSAPTVAVSPQEPAVAPEPSVPAPVVEAPPVAAPVVEVPAEPAVVAAVPVARVAPAVSAVKVEVPPTRSTKGALEAVDFKVVDGVSRVTVKLYGSCEPAQPVYGAQGLALTIKNCQVPKRLQRALNTSQFGSPVLSVTPYQVKVKGGMVAKILVRLRGNPSYTTSRKGDLLVLDIENPGPLPVAKLPAAPVAAAKTVPESRMAEELVPASRPEEAMTEIPKPDAEKRPGKKVYGGRRVTLEFSDADVRKIFQLIAEVSNLNFLIADDVTGTISIKLVNVPWDQALDVILDAKGLGMQRDGNIVQIKPKAKIQTQADEEAAAKKAAEHGMELRTAVFEVNYAAVTDVATQFTALKSDRGTITKDDRTSRVIVKDIQPALDDMRQLLKTLDAPEKQVMIEARIVEATSTFTRDLGVQWELHYKDGSASIAGINTVDSSFGGVVSPGPGTTGSGGLGLGMSFGKLSSNIQLDMRLSAAATIGQIKIVSTPKVVTLNNKAAKISQGQSIPYQTTSAEGTKTEFVEAALTLEVTPHITADGAVSMKIKASNNSPGTGSPPPINKKEATTELVVSNGETTVIGGIYVDNDTENDTGIPFLSDIPLLGWLFKSNSKTKTKTELLIFITPKVVL